MGAASEHSEEPKIRSSKWSLVSWSSLMESLTSSDSASAKKESSNRRPTSIWTVAGMAAITALFIYMIQTAFVVPGQKTAETPQVSCRPEGVSKSDLSTAGASLGSLAEQAGGRKMGGGRPIPEAESSSMNQQDSPGTQEQTSAEDRAEEGAAKSSRSQSQTGGEDKPKMAHVFISTDETDLRPIFVVINSTLANAK